MNIYIYYPGYNFTKYTTKYTSILHMYSTLRTQNVIWFINLLVYNSSSTTSAQKPPFSLHHHFQKPTTLISLLFYSIPNVPFFLFGMFQLCTALYIRNESSCSVVAGGLILFQRQYIDFMLPHKRSDNMAMI